METETNSNLSALGDPIVLREKIHRVAVIIACVLLTLIATETILVTNSNPIAIFVVLAAPIAFLVGLVQPKVGLSILLVTCGYLDLVKRIAYWFGLYSAGNQGVDTLQMSVLSFAPITLLGIFAGIIGRRIFVTKRIFEKQEQKPAAFAILANLLILAAGYKATHSLSEALSTGANAGSYLILLIIVPALFTSTDDIVDFLNSILIVFLPCALYGIWQGILGYTDLDVAWLKSGITITGIVLLDVKPRAFGTLASPHPYGLLYWFLLIGGYLFFQTKRWRIFYLLGMFIYAVGLFYGYGRGAWVALLAALGGYFCFKSRVLTLWFYGVALAAFALIAINAQFLLNQMGEFGAALPTESDTQQMALRIGTYSDRLIGFTNWMHSSQLWSWFGIREAYESSEMGSDAYVHDMLGEILVHYGAAGLLGVIIAGATSIVHFHRSIFRIPNERDRKLATLLLSMTASQFIVGGFAGPSYNVFPWNFFIWLIVGFLIVLCRSKPGDADPDQHVPEKPKIKKRSPFRKKNAQASGIAY